MDITDFAEDVRQKLDAKSKRRGRPPGSKNKAKKGKPAKKKVGRPPKAVEAPPPEPKKHALTDDGMHPVKRRGRPPKDAPVAPHVKQYGISHFKKNWTVELHGDKYVMCADGKKVGELVAKGVD